MIILQCYYLKLHGEIPQFHLNKNKLYYYKITAELNGWFLDDIE